MLAALGLLAWTQSASAQVKYRSIADSSKPVDGYTLEDFGGPDPMFGPGGRVVLNIGAQKDGESMSATWLHEDGRLMLIHAAYEPVPGITTEGVPYAKIINHIDSRGVLTGSAGGRLLRGRPGQFSPLTDLRVYDPVPDLPGEYYQSLSIQGLAGQDEPFLVSANYGGLPEDSGVWGRVTPPPRGTRVWLLRGGRLEPLVFTGDPVPGMPGVTFGPIELPSLGRSGRVLFAAKLSGPASPSTSFSGTSRADLRVEPPASSSEDPYSGRIERKGEDSPATLWFGLAGDPKPLLVEGQEVPGIPGLVCRTLRGMQGNDLGQLLVFIEVAGLGDSVLYYTRERGFSVVSHQFDTLDIDGAPRDIYRLHDPSLTADGRIFMVVNDGRFVGGRKLVIMSEPLVSSASPAPSQPGAALGSADAGAVAMASAPESAQLPDAPGSDGCSLSPGHSEGSGAWAFLVAALGLWRGVARRRRMTKV